MLAAFLNLTAQNALIVGGGRVALRRAAKLKAAGMRLSVVAPEVLDEVQALADSVHERPFKDSDIENAVPNGVALVVACTNDPALNDHVAALALGRGLLVNHAGNAQAGNLVFPATWEQPGVTVAVQTTPSVPMLSQAICAELTRRYPQPWPVERWAAQRQAALQLGPQAREGAMLELRCEIEQEIEQVVHS